MCFFPGKVRCFRVQYRPLQTPPGHRPVRGFFIALAGENPPPSPANTPFGSIRGDELPVCRASKPRTPRATFGSIKRSNNPSRVFDPIRGDELPVCRVPNPRLRPTHIFGLIKRSHSPSRVSDPSRSRTAGFPTCRTTAVHRRPRLPSPPPELWFNKAER